VVLAAAGYPDAPRKGDVIHGLPEAGEDYHVFHAGTVLKDRQVLPLLVLLSDGRANVGLGGGPVLPGKDEETRGLASLVREQRIPALVIDTELDFIKLGLAQGIAEAMGAAYLKLDDLRSESLAQAVRLHAPGGEQPLALSADQMLALARQVTGRA